MPSQTKIERLGENAEILVHQAKAEGKSYRDIAEEIETVFSESVSHQAVKNYLERFGNERAAQLGSKNADELQRQKTKAVMDSVEVLEKIHSKIENAFDSLDEQDIQQQGMLVKLSKEIRAQLKFQKEYLEMVSNPDTQVNNIEINQTDVMMEFNQYLNELEEEGAFVCENCGHKHIKIDAEQL